ncbi:MAG TPA: hypothetical protein VG777_03650, partial [Thermoanaerobaculia bacterium]|nr:hypothetical protein [Thermoanaerobaculia bacterium]
SARIEVAAPRVRAEVRPAAKPKGRRSTDAFDTWFVVTWRPVPTPSAEWIEWLRRAPFGSQTVRARRLQWDGRRLAIELMGEGDIEAFAAAMPDWVEFANLSSGKAGNTPQRRVLREAERRALDIEKKIRR